MQCLSPNETFRMKGFTRFYQIMSTLLKLGLNGYDKNTFLGVLHVVRISLTKKYPPFP